MKIELNNMATKHPNKNHRFEIEMVEDELFECGSPLKPVIKDNETNETYDGLDELLDCLNKLEDENSILRIENLMLKRMCEDYIIRLEHRAYGGYR